MSQLAIKKITCVYRTRNKMPVCLPETLLFNIDNRHRNPCFKMYTI